MHLERRLGAIASDVARAHRCEATTRYFRGYPVTRNDDASVAEFERILRDDLPSQQFVHMDAPVMGGEDFAFYAEAVPACFYLLGMEDGRWASAHLHQPTYDFNDAALPHGMEAMVTLALSDRGA